MTWDEGFPRLWRAVLHRRLGVLHCLLLERQSLAWDEGLPRLRGPGLYGGLWVLLHSLLLRWKSWTLKEGLSRLRGPILAGDLLVLLHSLLLRRKSLTLKEWLPRLHRPLGMGLSLDKLYRCHPLRLSLDHHWLRLSVGHDRWARGSLGISLNLVGMLSRPSILHPPGPLYYKLTRRWLPGNRSLSSRMRHLAWARRPPCHHRGLSGNLDGGALLPLVCGNRALWRSLDLCNCVWLSLNRGTGHGRTW